MNSAELEAYLRSRIPLSGAMQVHVRSIDEDALRIAAPLAPNINHRETVFGGSAAAVAMLAAWGLLYVRLERDAVPARLVIQRCEMEFLHPIESDFDAVSRVDDAADWPRFLDALRRKGRARVAVRVLLDCNGVRVGEFVGEFVALRAPMSQAQEA
jgi:thioesterase domain-containing protein